MSCIFWCNNCGREYYAGAGFSSDPNDVPVYVDDFDCPHCHNNRMHERRKKVWMDENNKIVKIRDYEMRIPTVDTHGLLGGFITGFQMDQIRERNKAIKKGRKAESGFVVRSIYEVLPNKNVEFNKQVDNNCDPIILSESDFLEVTGKSSTYSMDLYDYKIGKKRVMVFCDKFYPAN